MHLKVTGHAYHRGLLSGDFPAELALIAEADAGVVAALGGDEDYACGCLRTVDGGGCGILQHSHALDVVAVDVVDVVDLHAVHDDERAGVAHGGDTAHVHRACRGAGAAAAAAYHKAGDAALQGCGERGGLAGGKVGTLHGSHGAREVLLLDGAVTDDHDVVEDVGGAGHVYLHGAAVIGDVGGIVAYITHLHFLAAAAVEYEIAVDVGHDSLVGAFEAHAGADEGLAFLVEDGTFDLLYRAFAGGSFLGLTGDIDGHLTAVHIVVEADGLAHLGEHGVHLLVLKLDVDFRAELAFHALAIEEDVVAVGFDVLQHILGGLARG